MATTVLKYHKNLDPVGERTSYPNQSLFLMFSYHDQYPVNFILNYKGVVEAYDTDFLTGILMGYYEIL
jgi:hypothetical protein